MCVCVPGVFEPVIVPLQRHASRPSAITPSRTSSQVKSNQERQVKSFCPNHFRSQGEWRLIACLTHLVLHSANFARSINRTFRTDTRGATRDAECRIGHSRPRPTRPRPKPQLANSRIKLMVCKQSVCNARAACNASRLLHSLSSREHGRMVSANVRTAYEPSDCFLAATTP